MWGCLSADACECMDTHPQEALVKASGQRLLFPDIRLHRHTHTAGMENSGERCDPRPRVRVCAYVCVYV
jgi:hypothetical protein